MWAHGSPFWLPTAAESNFALQFASRRYHSDLVFLRIHCLVAAGYLLKVPRLLSVQTLFVLCGSLLPAALYHALPKGAAHVWRTPIFAALKLCKTGALLADLTSDTWLQQGPHPWSMLAFHLLFTARVVGYLAVGLGLQLPAALDLPLHLGLPALVMAYTVQRQCLGGPGPSGALGSGQRSLFQINRDKFHDMAAVLDWPFTLVGGPQDALTLSDQGVCTAVYVWVQLVAAFLIPATVLLVSEAAERRGFLAAQGSASMAAAGGGGGGAQHGASPFPWAYLCFAGQLCWCITRTLVSLSV